MAHRRGGSHQDTSDRWHPAEVEWHVLSEYRDLMLGWIEEWEFDGYDSLDPDVWFGGLRDEPIEVAEAERWVRSHWVRPPAGPARPCRMSCSEDEDEDEDEDEKGKLLHEWAAEQGIPEGETAAMWRERMRQEEARHGDRAARMAARWRKRLERAETLHGARPVRPGPAPWGYPAQARVYMVVMVAFLVFAGLTATKYRNRVRRKEDEADQDTACDAVAKGVGVPYKSVAKAWERYKRFFPFNGRSPVSPNPNEGKRGYRLLKTDVVTEEERRRLAYEWIMIGFRTRALGVKLRDYYFPDYVQSSSSEPVRSV